MRIRKKSLIPRYQLPMTTREVTLTAPTADDPFYNASNDYVFTNSVSDACTLQSLSAYQVSMLPESVRTKSPMTLFTNTIMMAPIEGSTRLADAIFIPHTMFGDDTPEEMEGWFVISSVKYRLNDIVSYTECILYKDNNLLNKDGVSQFPDVTTLKTETDTKAKLLSGDWITGWIA